MKPTPPHRALKFLRWFCREDYLEEVEGDLIEVFEKQYEDNPARARRKFRYSVIRYFRPAFIKSLKIGQHANTTIMFRHNLLLTLRHFRKYKTSFFINLIGLTTGLASVLLIYLWVQNETSKDQFHQHKDQLYQVLRNIDIGSYGILTVETNSMLLAPALSEELEEVARIVPVADEFSSAIVSTDQVKMKADGKLAGKDFFNIFSFNLVQGNKDEVLSNKNAVVISQQMAHNFFPLEHNVLGKTLNVLDNTDGETVYAGDYVVTGVFDQTGLNTSESFDFLLTNALYVDKRDLDDHSWDSNGNNVYLTIKEGVDIDQFNDKINDFYRSKLVTLFGEKDPASISTMFLQPYADRYLHNKYKNGQQAGGRIDYVILFSAVGMILLLIACINFMNLSTAHASRRLKEVGVKKVVGASRAGLVSQYIGESMLLVLISSIVALIVVFILLPHFNTLTGKALILTWDVNLIAGVLLIMLFTGFTSASYPAFFLSRLKPVALLRIKLKTSFGELLTRRGLVVFQFCMSIILIVSVIVVTKQIDFVHAKNLGYNKDNMLTFRKEGNLMERIDPFLDQARNTAGVLNATILEGSVSNFSNSGGGFPNEEREYIQFTFSRVGYDYIETLGITLKEGRSFSRKFNNEGSKIILNETALKTMQLDDPIGKVVNIRGNREIIGIVKDFHFKSLYERIEPMFLIFQPEDANRIVVNIQSGTEKETIERLTNLYHRFNPDLPFEFEFIDNEYEALYLSEQRIASLSKYFTIIAILISCLGLFGLAAYSAERRLKEIGIRKILGSSELGVIRLLTSDFTKMVVMAIVIALPISYSLVARWLESFAYRIELQWWFFTGAGLLALLIAWLTVGMQTIKAAKVNPVACLKDE
jgi:ABC-type antimicrobial peptide transport system permease subunit